MFDSKRQSIANQNLSGSKPKTLVEDYVDFKHGAAAI
jgi:hypothetical protein